MRGEGPGCEMLIKTYFINIVSGATISIQLDLFKHSQATLKIIVLTHCFQKGKTKENNVLVTQKWPIGR